MRALPQASETGIETGKLLIPLTKLERTTRYGSSNLEGVEVRQVDHR
jgi:hypothetical protein